MARTFVIGDIHGAYRALLQCLARSEFNYQSDVLICLGDVCDGWPETRQCIDELLRIKNLIYLLGNHDTWLLKWMTTGLVENIWYIQGGEASILSYAGIDIPVSHISFLQKAKKYHSVGNKLFVHAGISIYRSLDLQDDDVFLWDRTLAKNALKRYKENDSTVQSSFEEIYIGHTPTSFGKPVKGGEVWLMDTGAGWSGCLSMLNVDTKEYFVSDDVPLLYPGVKGRSRG
jgi:serine/threonine protein phosphatase 1